MRRRRWCWDCALRGRRNGRGYLWYSRGMICPGRSGARLRFIDCWMGVRYDCIVLPLASRSLEFSSALTSIPITCIESKILPFGLRDRRTFYAAGSSPEREFLYRQHETLVRTIRPLGLHCLNLALYALTRSSSSLMYSILRSRKAACASRDCVCLRASSVYICIESSDTVKSLDLGLTAFLPPFPLRLAIRLRRLHIKLRTIRLIVESHCNASESKKCLKISGGFLSHDANETTKKWSKKMKYQKKVGCRGKWSDGAISEPVIGVDKEKCLSNGFNWVYVSAACEMPATQMASPFEVANEDFNGPMFSCFILFSLRGSRGAVKGGEHVMINFGPSCWSLCLAA